MKLKEIKYIYFGGCAWGNIAYIGILKALRDNYSNEYINNIIFHGDSAGSLIALVCVLNIDIEIIILLYIKYSKIVDKNGFLFKMNKHITNMFYEIIKNIKYNNIIKIFNKKLKIGITKFPNTYILKNNWNSIDELLDDILCTTYIPALSSYRSTNNFFPIVDGSYTFKREYIPNNNSITIGFNSKKTQIYDIGIHIPDHRLIYPFFNEDIFNMMNTYYNMFIVYINKNGNQKIILKNNRSNLYKLPVLWSLWLLNLPFMKK